MQRKFLVITMVLALMLALVPSAMAQTGDDGGDDTSDAECNNSLDALVEAIEDSELNTEEEITCEVLLEYQDEGDFGVGEMWQPYRIMQSADNMYADDPSEVVDEDYAAADITYEMLLDARSGGEEEDGLGWGKVRQLYFIVASGTGEWDEVLGLYQDGMGWGKIREELGLDPGPPPWARGGNKDKDKSSNGNGNGNGNGGGNGNGNGHGGGRPDNPGNGNGGGPKDKDKDK